MREKQLSLWGISRESRLQQLGRNKTFVGIMGGLFSLSIAIPVGATWLTNRVHHEERAAGTEIAKGFSDQLQKEHLANRTFTQFKKDNSPKDIATTLNDYIPQIETILGEDINGDGVIGTPGPSNHPLKHGQIAAPIRPTPTTQR